MPEKYELKHIYEEKDMEEVFKMMEEQGLHPLLCDTMVPVYENPVRCGIPTDVGDPIMDYVMMPSELVGRGDVHFCKAEGDSMTGADIHEGDWLKVNCDCVPQEGDYVIAWIDGDSTVKTLCKDEEGIIWLVPQNDNYKPTKLKETQNVRIQGVITDVYRPLPRCSYSRCMERIHKMKAEELQALEIEQYEVAKAIREIAPMVTIARQWYAVFRAMVDLDVLKTWDYDEFCVMVKEELPDNKHLPTRLEMQRMAVGSFTKPVIFWTEKDAPVKGKRYDTYKKLALKTKELLGR